MLFLLHLKFTSLTLLSNLNLIITISLSDFETVPVQGASDVARMWSGQARRHRHTGSGGDNIFSFSLKKKICLPCFSA